MLDSPDSARISGCARDGAGAPSRTQGIDRPIATAAGSSNSSPHVPAEGDDSVLHRPRSDRRSGEPDRSMHLDRGGLPHPVGPEVGQHRAHLPPKETPRTARTAPWDSVSESGSIAASAPTGVSIAEGHTALPAWVVAPQALLWAVARFPVQHRGSAPEANVTCRHGGPSPGFPRPRLHCCPSMGPQPSALREKGLEPPQGPGIDHAFR